MSPQQRSKQRENFWRKFWRKFWRDWGVFLLISAALAGGVILFAVLLTPGSREEPGISTVAPYRVYFTQGDVGTQAPQGLEAEIVADIAAAKASVDVATPGLDLEMLTDALIEAKERGVEVRVLENPPKADDAAVISTTARLEDHGVLVKTHPAERGLGEAFIVVDQQLVWAGSWDLSQRGLQEDAAFILRWEMPEMAGVFHGEFMEMYADGQFGPTSPANTSPRYFALPDGRVTTLYLTPEDDPFAEVLQSIAGVKGSIVLLIEGLNDIRVGDRLIGESYSVQVQIGGVLGPGGSAPGIIDALRQQGAVLVDYAGPGKMRENAIIVDSEITIIFSQRLYQEELDRNDGFVLVVRDEVLAVTFEREFSRLLNQVQPEP